MTTQLPPDRAPARARPAHPDHALTAPEQATPPRVDAAPGFETWLKILLAALVPASAAIWLVSWRMPLFALTGALLAAGLVALVREERRRGAAERR